MYDILEKKRNNEKLSKEEIEFFVNEYTNDNIPDYQMSALLMAICINGMSDKEILNLTLAMTNSGDKLDLSDIDGIVVDKHSTGGVGDKTTLIVAPIVACLGIKVAKMSGRGLGHSGGTIDKLESIPGYQVDMGLKQFIEQVNKIGLGLISQTGDFAPADKKIYALRDVTGTVESIPLIAASIMSKKLAIGATGIVLDVKVGNGAFMKDKKSALDLAKQMVKIGNNAGHKTVTILTNMNVPLGNNIGNSLEVIEAIEVLKGNGPNDLKEISIELASEMVSIGSDISYDEAKNKVVSVLESGEAFTKFKELILAQNGELKYIEDVQLFDKAINNIEVIAIKSGYIKSMDTKEIGKISVSLGAGRKDKKDRIDYSAGIILNKKIGDYVTEGEVLATLYSSKVDPNAFVTSYLKTIEYSDSEVTKEPLIIEKIY